MARVQTRVEKMTHVLKIMYDNWSTDGKKSF